ncbi:MAG: hypothetical protein ABI675_27695 [Chitinophagaceae bacterium]
MKKFFTILLLLLAVNAQSQVKIGNNPNTIDANSLLELESTNKGFLPPRVALNDASLVAPLTGTVPAGMLVFSTGGTLADGYYYWNGTQWKLVATAELNVVSKPATTTLLKTETMVLASNDITVTLPAVTASDNGLTITVKNTGTHTDLITIKGDAGATVDETDSSTLTRYCSQTFVAAGGNWVVKGKQTRSKNLLDVSPNSSWTTIQEAVEFLEAHMDGPTVVRLGEETYEIDQTIVVDLDFPLTFQGLSYGTVTLAAATGLANKPMFRCVSDCYFKMLQFDATSLTSYGTQPGEDAIRFIGSGTYNEIKDCTFDRFYDTILDSTDAELWVFETDISNASNNGILIHSNEDSVTVKVAETDFIGCKRGINMSKGIKAILQLASGGYYNAGATDTAIVYRPSTFTSFISISITGNSWNNAGKFIEGFDFTLSTGRDANIIMENNAGMADKKPSCYINITNNTTTTVLALVSTWYKINWDYLKTSFSTCKWTVTNAVGGIANVNRIAYQPTNRRDAYITISGNIMTNQSSSVINIGIVKNPVTTNALATGITRYGETTLRPGVANQPIQFSTVIYLSDIAPGAYYELWCNSTVANTTITIQDIQVLVSTQ